MYMNKFCLQSNCKLFI